MLTLKHTLNIYYSTLIIVDSISLVRLGVPERANLIYPLLTN